ncbi:MAG: hypothetical protein RBU30_24575 [Polyangia bacterium]|nr:hypothetical protein [Polyangia bacterium]
MDPMMLAERIGRLQGDEQQILEVILDRLEQGQDDYGPWQVEDGRDYGEEAFTEVIDGLHYCAAGLVRLRRRSDR